MVGLPVSHPKGFSYYTFSKCFPAERFRAFTLKVKRQGGNVMSSLVSGTFSITTVVSKETELS